MKKIPLLLFILITAFSLHAQTATDSTTTQTATFNVNEATQHYLNTLSGAARAKSDAYFEGGYWLIIWNALAAILAGCIFLMTGLSKGMKRLVDRVGNVNLQNYLYAVLYFILSWIILFPLNVYQGYFREHQYNLSNLNFMGWLGQEMIGLGLAAFVGSLVIVLIYMAMRKTGKNWWLWGAGIAIFFAAFGAFIAPVWISPLFNKYEPLPDGPLKTEILSMARANNIPAQNVYRFDASKQSDRVSANVSGLGSTTRISLNDNLLKRCSLAEIKSVMGHEMGHYVMNHVYKGLTDALILIVVLFALVNFGFNFVIKRMGVRLGLNTISDIGSLPLVVVLFTIVGFFFTPINNTLTRTQEIEADMFGLNAAREPDANARVDMMLSEYRKIDPGYWEEILFYDHPSGRNRVHAAMQWKAENMNSEK